VLDHLRLQPGTLLEAVLDRHAPLPKGPDWSEADPEFLLVVTLPGTTEASLEPTSHELGSLLAAAQQPLALRDLCAVAVALEAEPDEAADIIRVCLDDRLLYALPPHGSTSRGA
jgi:hypothetical protein